MTENAGTCIPITNLSRCANGGRSLMLICIPSARREFSFHVVIEIHVEDGVLIRSFRGKYVWPARLQFLASTDIVLLGRWSSSCSLMMALLVWMIDIGKECTTFICRLFHDLFILPNTGWLQHTLDAVILLVIE